MIEIETPGDSRTMFRALMDRLVIEENLTAAQARLIVGKVLDRITLPRAGEEAFRTIIDRPVLRKN